MVKLMSDQRQAELFKAAEACVSLMNIGVTPNAALRKVADDSQLNDKEVVLVSHAVNNSKQLAHLQSMKAEDKESPFPLTNADVVTKERYSKDETKSRSAEQDADQPDALGIKENLDKIATANRETRSFHGSPKQASVTEDFRKTWGAEGVTKIADYVDPNPFAKIAYIRIGIDEAGTIAEGQQMEAAAILESLGREFRKTAAPDFKLFEKAAGIAGVSPDTLDLVYAYGSLEKAGHVRINEHEKTARLYVPADVMGLVERCVHADTLWKSAADYLAAKTLLEARYNAEYVKLAGGGLDWAMGENNNVKLDASLAGVGEALGTAPQDLFGLGADPNATVMDAAGISKPEGFEASPSLDKTMRQDLANVDARSKLEGLMQDHYISGHPLPEVIDAYNAAMSVNPQFGQAELTSYMRQHLASKGAVPLDLQVRASGGHRTHAEGK